MGELKAIVVATGRAKPLTRSGVFEAVHVSQHETSQVATVVSEAGSPAAVQGCNERASSADDALNARAMTALKRCMVAFGLNNGDLGAVIGKSKEDVRRILEGIKPLTIKHQMRMHERLPALHSMYAKELFG